MAAVPFPVAAAMPDGGFCFELCVVVVRGLNARWLWFAGGFVAVTALSWAVFFGRDVLLFNPSHSMPVGFYVRVDDAPRVGAFVTVRAGEVSPDYAEARDFAGPGNRFLKRVAAMAGAEVCARGDEVTIDGVRTVSRASIDSAGRTLPRWHGCRVLAEDELLLGDTADSFDGRYWGPVRLEAIEGVWRPLRFGEGRASR